MMHLSILIKGVEWGNPNGVPWIVLHGWMDTRLIATSAFGPLGNEKYIEYSNDIQASGRYLLAIISDILDMSKIEAGRVQIETKQCEFGTIIDHAFRISTRTRKAGPPERVDGMTLGIVEMNSSAPVAMTNTSSTTTAIAMRMNRSSFSSAAPQPSGRSSLPPDVVIRLVATRVKPRQPDVTCTLV